MDALAEEYLRLRSETSPLWATFLGVPGYDGVLPDAGAAGEAESAARLRDVAARAEAVEPASLHHDDRVTRSVLVHEARGLAEQLDDGHTGFSVYGPFAPLSQLVTVAAMTTSPGDQRERLRALPLYLGQLGERFSTAAREGRGPQAQGLATAVRQLETHLALPLHDDPLLGPADPGDAADLLRDGVRPALRSLLDVLSGPVKDAARGDDRPGLVHVPGGESVYRRALAQHTTTARTPEEIHRTGLDLCAQLREEYAVLGESVFGTRDVAAVLDRLRNDAGLRYSTAQEMLDDARDALRRAEQVLPAWFGRTHRARCEVEPMGPVEAPGGVLGRYIPAAPDGSRPALHLLNTHHPQTRTRFEYETLAFHESVPGHHTQLAVGQELGERVPAFRRHGYIAAFSEGWALYTERLCDEMGLYSGDLARFGMVSFDSWRACRLVVDTGMHALGWTRDRAVEFMWENSALTMANIVNEVDRYIAWPGQACAYTIGRLEIADLREQARRAPGYDVRAFHDAVLQHGSVPLTVLRDEVARTLHL